MNAQQLAMVLAALSVAQLRQLADVKEASENQMSNIIGGQSTVPSSGSGAAGQVPDNVSTRTGTGRTMSVEGRERIAAAQRARWANIKKGNKGSKVARKGKGSVTANGRFMSDEARARIAAAQKARWAKVKSTARKARKDATTAPTAPVTSTAISNPALATATA